MKFSVRDILWVMISVALFSSFVMSHLAFLEMKHAYATLEQQHKEQSELLSGLRSDYFTLRRSADKMWWRQNKGIWLKDYKFSEPPIRTKDGRLFSPYSPFNELDENGNEIDPWDEITDPTPGYEDNPLHDPKYNQPNPAPLISPQDEMQDSFTHSRMIQRHKLGCN